MSDDGLIRAVAKALSTPDRAAVPPAPRQPTLPTLSMDLLFEANLCQHRRVFDGMEQLQPAICAAAQMMTESLARGGRLLFMGNGGSASDCQHLSAEFNGRLRRERAPLAAMALTADTATLTAIANDYGYEEVFARQIAAHARHGDCVIAISTSGESENVLRGLAAASARGVRTVGLLGREGGRARSMVDLAVVVPHDDSARIQEAHIFIGHTWCGQIETALRLVS